MPDALARPPQTPPSQRSVRERRRAPISLTKSPSVGLFKFTVGLSSSFAFAFSNSASLKAPAWCNSCKRLISSATLIDVPFQKMQIARAAPAARWSELQVQQQARWIFQGFLHGHQAEHGFAAVDDAVVVGHGQVVHRTHHDHAVLDDSAVLGRVHAQDGRLGRVDDRGRQHGAEGAAVRDREGTARQIFQGQLACLGLDAELADFLLDVGDRHLVRIAQDGHDQAARRTDGDTDVEIAVVDDVVAIDGSVDDRVLLQGGNGGLDEEGHEAQLDAVLFLELVLVLVAQVDDRLHVDFVERGQNRVGRLRLHQALGDTGAQAAHRHALFGRLPRLARLATAGAATCCRAGLAGAAGAANGAGAAGLTPPAMAPITSPLVTRPSLPVPATSVADIEFSASILAAAGMAMSPLPAGDAVSAVGTGAFGVATDLTSSGLTWAEASVSMMAMTSPATTVEPSPLMIWTMVPAAGAGSSRTTLSVSISIRFSSRATGSPTFLCHASMVASATDSDSWGTLTSICAM